MYIVDRKEFCIWVGVLFTVICLWSSSIIEIQNGNFLRKVFLLFNVTNHITIEGGEVNKRIH